MIDRKEQIARKIQISEEILEICKEGKKKTIHMYIISLLVIIIASNTTCLSTVCLHYNNSYK